MKEPDVSLELTFEAGMPEDCFKSVADVLALLEGALMAAFEVFVAVLGADFTVLFAGLGAGFAFVCVVVRALFAPASRAFSVAGVAGCAVLRAGLVADPLVDFATVAFMASPDNELLDLSCPVSESFSGDPQPVRLRDVRRLFPTAASDED